MPSLLTLLLCYSNLQKYTTVRGAPKVNGDDSYSGYNPVAAAQNAASNTDGTTTEKVKTAAVAAGGAAAAGAGAAFAATRDAGARAVNGAGATAEKSTDDLSKSELQAEVARLRRELEVSKRSNGGATLQQSSAEGVPVHIVAAIAFGVFAITYIMF